MRFFKKLNRGAIVFAIVFLCAVIGVSVISSSRSNQLAEITDVLNSFYVDSFPVFAEAAEYEKGADLSDIIKKADGALSKYYAKDADSEGLAGAFENFGAGSITLYDGEEMDAVYVNPNSVVWKDGCISLTCGFRYYTSNVYDKGIASVNFEFIFEEIEGEWKITFWRNEAGYEEMGGFF